MAEDPKAEDAVNTQKKVKFPSIQMRYSTEDSKQDKEQARPLICIVIVVFQEGTHQRDAGYSVCHKSSSNTRHLI